MKKRIEKRKKRKIQMKIRMAKPRGEVLRTPGLLISNYRIKPGSV